MPRPPNPLPMTMILLGNRLGFQIIEHVLDLPGLRAERSEEGAGVLELLLEGFPGGRVAVVKIVHQLIRYAELVAEFGDLMAEGLIEGRAEEAGAGGELEKGRRFEFRQAAGGTTGIGKIHGLAADEGVAIEDAKEFLLETAEAFGFGGAGDAFGRVTGGEGDEAEGGEKGGSLAELAVDGGLSAARHFVVHAGKVVDDERGAVEEFDGNGSAGDEADVGAGEPADAKGEDGPEALASGEDSKAHRLEDWIRSAAGMVTEDRFQGVIDEGSVGDEGRQCCRAHHNTP